MYNIFYDFMKNSSSYTPGKWGMLQLSSSYCLMPLDCSWHLVQQLLQDHPRFRECFEQIIVKTVGWNQYKRSFAGCTKLQRTELSIKVLTSRESLRTETEMGLMERDACYLDQWDQVLLCTCMWCKPGWKVDMYLLKGVWSNTYSSFIWCSQQLSEICWEKANSQVY